MQITVIQPTGAQESAAINKHPYECPHCHKSITPQQFQGFKNDKLIEVVFRCPDHSCRKVFMGYYEFEGVGSEYLFQRTSLGSVRARTFSENIEGISSAFIEIYNQTVAAEGYGLIHITGIGYRKALEFLIKDYLIVKFPNKKQDIIEKFLGNCINEFVDNQNIKDMAQRAAWLGNDQTHYSKKWINKDITDLKTLIDVTIHWIEMEKLTEKFKSEMK